MIIVRGKAPGAPSDERGPTFTGQVWADPVLPGVDGTTITSIMFTPGARTFWHHHERGQILQVTAGTGFVCSRGEEPQRLRTGDTVWVPPLEEHWHGADADSVLAHTAISLGATRWADEVSATDYAAANNRGAV